MGIFPGSQIEVLSNSRGHVLVRVRGAAIALSRGVASKILVKRT